MSNRFRKQMISFNAILNAIILLKRINTNVKQAYAFLCFKRTINEPTRISNFFECSMSEMILQTMILQFYKVIGHISL